MSFRFDPTHHVVDRRLAGSEEGDPTIRVDNAVAAVAVEYGDEIRVRAARKPLGNDPAAAEAFAALERVPRGDRRSDGVERRGRLPEDRAAVETLLDFEGRFARDGDAHAARLFGVAEYTVFAGETPLYHSVPHETSVRDLNDAVPGFVSDAAAAVAAFPGVAVFPVDPLVRWRVDGRTYELTAENVRTPDPNEEGWRWFDLSKLAYVRAVPERGELALQWREPGGPPLVARARERISRLLTPDRPTRFPVSAATLRELTETFVRLREDLDYGFVVDAAGLADGADDLDVSSAPEESSESGESNGVGERRANG